MVREEKTTWDESGRRRACAHAANKTSRQADIVAMLSRTAQSPATP
jgi:hypothetical protein